MIKRILFLAPYSIPVNNPEAICNAKLLKVLCEAGYVIDVISKNNNRAYSPNANDQIFIEKISYIKTFYLSNKINVRTVVDHIRTFLKTGYVYKGAHWAVYAINEAERLIKNHDYDLIMSRSPSSELAALYLSKKYGIKWIANWNDPYPESFFPIPYGKGYENRGGLLYSHLFRQIRRYALVHSFPSVRLKNYMQNYLLLDDKDCYIIPHVCLEGLLSESILEPKHSDGLRVIHSGNISYPRSPYLLFDAIVEFKKRNTSSKIHFTFIGKQDEDFQSIVEKYGLQEIVEVILPQNYVSNLSLMTGFDVALLVEADLKEGIFLPTKVGDYMQCRLPIWSISPSLGELHDLYIQKKISYFSDVCSVSSIVLELEKIYADFINMNIPVSQVIEDYCSQKVLELYENLFESIEHINR